MDGISADQPGLAWRLVRSAAVGAALGALLIGAGGRVVMRILALSIDRPAVFSLGGSLDVVVYGALVGLAGGLLHALLERLGLGSWIRALGVALLTYGGTVVTLPAHIAMTAEPFADRMALVFGLFAVPFLAYGLALEWIVRLFRFAKAGPRH